VGGERRAVVTPYAFLFPGQGSQAPGMGKELADAFPESRAVFTEADEALGTPLSRTCFEGTAAELARTETTQPAILTVSIAALRAIAGRGLAPAAVAGHSLGEYSAHVAAGTISFADAVRTVRLRGRFMQEAVPEGVGAMAAILGMDLEPLDRVCRDAAEGEVVSPANLNAPGQIVIAGHAAAVRRASERALAAGARKAMPLPVSAPFHCALMAPAATRLEEVLDGVTLADPRIPVWANADVSRVTDAAAARATLVRQVTAPVRWMDTIRALHASGIRTFVEVGPGRVLAGLVRRILDDARVLTVSEPKDVDTAAGELGAAA
jgi:[acyl-carrier-protein] S-malonyltransferase